MADYAKARANMVDCQLRPNRVGDPAVLEAFGEIPRENFLPGPLQAIAYVDEDLPVGEGRYLGEPMVIARMIQALDIKPSDAALVIGCATGYTSAVVSRLATIVVHLEEDPAFAKSAAGTLSERAFDNVVVVEGRHRDGYPDQAPYDVILFAGAIPDIPQAVIDQLAEGGRLAAVVDGGSGTGTGQSVLVERLHGLVGRRVLFDAAMPRLPSFAQEPEFTF
jgi:protein-L-isoaspartate(D-aspartate) O-methyltransferase